MTRRLVVHSVALWVALLALTWVVDVDGGVYDADDGAFMVQLRVLAETGEWWAPDPAAQLDPEGRFNAIAHARVDQGLILPFPSRPAHMLVSVPIWEFAGIRGVTIMGITGLAVAAWAVAEVSRLIDQRASVLALWLTGLGTPLLFQSLALQGHGIAAGFGSLALLMIARSIADLTQPSPKLTAGRVLLISSVTLVAMTLAALIRRESSVFALAMAAGAGVVFLSTRRARVLIPATAAVIGAGIGVLLDQALHRNLFGLVRNLPSNRADASFLEHRLHSFGRMIMPGYQSDSEVAMVLAIGAMLLALAAVVLFIRHGSARDLIGGLGLAAALVLVRLLLEPTPMINGLFSAFPLALGLVILGLHRLSSSAVARTLLVTFGIGVVLTGLTQYPAAGGFEWGSRYLSLPLLALLPVGACALVALHDALTERSHRIAVTVLLATLVVAPSAMGLAAQRHARHTNTANVAAGYTAAADLGTDIVVSTHPEIPRTNIRYLIEGRPWFHAWAEELPPLR